MNKLIFSIIFLIYLTKISAVIHHNFHPMKGYNSKNHHPHKDLTIHKVSFTQKGYIQFLRYIADVPPLTDYTFCIWVRSNNLTYSHPLLSYSIHDKERLIRVWISPGGTDINLEILQHHLFKIPIKFIENHWYHVCQSWSSHQSAWNLYLNGKLKATGFEPKLQDITIPGGGDIVVGQEYTDFDKGLDDGIEGDVFGFNFILAPTVTTTINQRYLNRRHFLDNGRETVRPADDVPEVLRYFSVEPNRQPKGLFNFDFDLSRLFHEKPPPASRVRFPSAQHRLVNDVDDNPKSSKALGSILVELGYKCWVGRGAPIVGKEVLISWTKTPVRVFGGAILKIGKPFCL